MSLKNSYIRYIKYIPSKLEILDLSDTDIECIPELPNSLKKIYCNNTYKLYKILNIPISLKVLDMISSKILLPQLPEGLLYLRIYSLDMLDNNILPNSIEHLETKEIYLSIDDSKIYWLCLINLDGFLYFFLKNNNKKYLKYL